MKPGHPTGQIPGKAGDSENKSSLVKIRQCDVEGNRWLKGLKRYFLPPNMCE